MKKAAGSNAKDCALRFLRYGDRTTAEMRIHLEKKGYEVAEIEEVMCFLSECRFIDDENYCRRYVETGIEKRKSAGNMTAELIRKGVDKSVIRRCIEECLTPEITFENALAEARKYMDRRNLDTEKAGINKIMQRLAYLGYEGDVINEVARSLKKGWDESSDF